MLESDAMVPVRFLAQAAIPTISLLLLLSLPRRDEHLPRGEDFRERCVVAGRVVIIDNGENNLLEIARKLLDHLREDFGDVTRRIVESAAAQGPEDQRVVPMFPGDQKDLSYLFSGPPCNSIVESIGGFHLRVTICSYCDEIQIEGLLQEGIAIALCTSEKTHMRRVHATKFIHGVRPIPGRAGIVQFCQVLSRAKGGERDEQSS